MGSELRRASPQDAAAIAGLTAASFETYRSFAPAGWQPPDEGVERVARRLADPEGFAVVVEDLGELVAFGAYEQARRPHPDGPRVDGLAHVWGLFVAERRWGTGLGSVLLAAVIDAAAGEGPFREARLFTPEGQRRARAFYAREGWREVSGPFASPLGLDLVELRRAL